MFDPLPSSDGCGLGLGFENLAHFTWPWKLDISTDLQVVWTSSCNFIGLYSSDSVDEKDNMGVLL